MVIFIYCVRVRETAKGKTTSAALGITDLLQFRSLCRQTHVIDFRGRERVVTNTLLADDWPVVVVVTHLTPTRR